MGLILPLAANGGFTACILMWRIPAFGRLPPDALPGTGRSMFSQEARGATFALDPDLTVANGACAAAEMARSPETVLRCSSQMTSCSRRCR